MIYVIIKGFDYEGFEIVGYVEDNEVAVKEKVKELWEKDVDWNGYYDYEKIEKI